MNSWKMATMMMTGCGGDDEFPPDAEGDDKRNQIMRSLP